MENKYIGILRRGYNLPENRFTKGNEGKIFELLENGNYYGNGAAFTPDQIKSDLEKGYLRENKDGK